MTRKILMGVFCAVALVACGESEKKQTSFLPQNDMQSDMGGDDGTTDMVVDMVDMTEDATDDMPDATEDMPVEQKDIAEQLADLPGVANVQELRGQGDYRVFTISIRQGIDQFGVEVPTFIQNVHLFHRSVDAPTVMVTSGYGLGEVDRYRNFPIEVSQLLNANQLFLGHRFFAGALPEGAMQDWDKVNIRQGAADNHRIVSKLKKIYKQAWVGTGWSKGGMTAIFHERFYPDDLDLVIPMVAPISRAPMDPRYPPFLASIGTEDCRNRLEQSIIDTIGRIDELLDAYQVPPTQRPQQHARFKYQFISYPWSYWQYLGQDACDTIPDGKTATLQDLVTFYFYYNQSPKPGFPIDEEQSASYTYGYQAMTELGYQDVFAAGYLERLQMLGLLSQQEFSQYRFTYRDQYSFQAPWDVLPPFNPEVMKDIDTWLKEDAKDVLAIYGEFDPWTAAKVTLNEANKSKVYIAPQANHGTMLSDLSFEDYKEVESRILGLKTANPLRLHRTVKPKVDREKLKALLRDKLL